MQPFVYCPPQDELSVVFEDEHFIAINKPSGLLSVMGRLLEHFDSAYYRILQKYPTAKVIHRLDMATSGILLFAKYRDVEVMMSKLFQQRLVDKQYIALVEGHLQGNGKVDAPLIADWENRPRQKVDFENGKAALTFYESEQYDYKQNHTRVRLTPITGRSHQLRLHLAYLGHPILGDRIYHPNAERFSLGRLALHAAHLAFDHPITQEKVILTSEVPF